MVQMSLWLLVLLRVFSLVTASVFPPPHEETDSESTDGSLSLERPESIDSHEVPSPSLQIQGFSVLQLASSLSVGPTGNAVTLKASEAKPRESARIFKSSPRPRSISSPFPKRLASSEQLRDFTIVGADTSSFDTESNSPKARSISEAIRPSSLISSCHSGSHPHLHKHLHVHMGDIDVAASMSKEEEAVDVSKRTSCSTGSKETDNLRDLIFVAAKHGSIESFRLHWNQYMELFGGFQNGEHDSHTLLFDAVIGDSPEIIKLVLKARGFDALADADPAELSEDDEKDSSEDTENEDNVRSEVSSMRSEPQGTRVRAKTMPAKLVPSRSYSNEYHFDGSDSDSDKDTNVFGETHAMLALAAEHNALRTVKWLVKRHKVMDVPPWEGSSSALSEAVRNRHPLMVQYLLKHAGSQVNRIEPSRHRHVLFEAIELLHPDRDTHSKSKAHLKNHSHKCVLSIVAALISNKAALDVSNSSLDYPLHLAVSKEDIPLVEELLKAEDELVHSALFLKNRLGMTAFAASALLPTKSIRGQLNQLLADKIAKVDMKQHAI